MKARRRIHVTQRYARAHAVPQSWVDLAISPGRRPREILFGPHRGGSCDVRQTASAWWEFIDFIEFNSLRRYSFDSILFAGFDLCCCTPGLAVRSGRAERV